MRIALLLVGFLLGCISSLHADDHASSDTSKPTPQQIETERKLKSIVFDKWYPRESPMRGDLRRDVAELERRSKALDPSHIGVTFRLQPPDLEYLNLAQKRYSADLLQWRGRNLKNIPLAVLLADFLEMQNFDYRVEPDGVVLISPLDGNSPEYKKFCAKLENILIDKFDMLVSHKPGDLQRDLTYLSKRSRELDPEHIGVTIRLLDPRSDYPAKRSPGSSPHYDMTLTDTPLFELVAYVCQRAGLSLRVGSGEVLLGP